MNWAAIDLAIVRLRKSKIDLTSSDRIIALRVQRFMNVRILSEEISGYRSIRDYISKLQKSGNLPPENSRHRNAFIV